MSRPKATEPAALTRARAERDEARAAARLFFDHLDFRSPETAEHWKSRYPWLTTVRPAAEE